MTRVGGVLALFAVAGAIAGVTARTATAVPMPEHVVGDQCIGADIGRKDVAPNGQAIICDSNYRWEPDIGQTPSDPWVSGQK